MTVLTRIRVTGRDCKVRFVVPRGQQGRSLARYLQREVRAYSAFHRPALERAFRERDGRSGIDLASLPLTALSDVDDPTGVVLRPDFATMQRYGSPRLYARVLWARATGRVGSVNRSLIEPTYKPIHWMSEDGFLVGATSADLDRLAELGRRWLELAGVQASDVVVSVVRPGPRLAFWELALATRRSGLGHHAQHVVRRTDQHRWPQPRHLRPRRGDG